MLTLEWTRGADGSTSTGTYTLSDSATGMTAALVDTAKGGDLAVAWLKANADLLVARAALHMGFVGEVPEAPE